MGNWGEEVVNSILENNPNPGHDICRACEIVKTQTRGKNVNLNT